MRNGGCKFKGKNGFKVERMKVLAIGNSFSEDALYYLHDICQAAGISCKAVNLYIGGCSLKQHQENFMSGERAYEYQLNGMPQGRMVSSREVLEEEKWDYILTQQASHDSGLWETYEPWLTYFTEGLRRCCPEAEILLQKTWAYEKDSGHDAFLRYHCSQEEMYEMLSICYEKASQKTGVRLIPSADVIQAVRKEKGFRYELGEQSLCRDGFHMHMIYGRFLLGALLFSFLTENDIMGNSFLPGNARPELIMIIKECIRKRSGKS